MACHRSMDLVASESDIAWSTVVVSRTDDAVDAPPVTMVTLTTQTNNALSLVDQANNLCDRLDGAIQRATKPAAPVAADELTTLSNA